MEDSTAAAHPRIAVVGLWHLGCVTAACLANAEWPVLGLDEDRERIAALEENRPPLFEPGLAKMIAERRAAGQLAFGEIGAAETAEAEVIWITFDTPVDDEDRADVGLVLAQSERALAAAGEGALVVAPRSCPSAR